jgi:hypothetical protein
VYLCFLLTLCSGHNYASSPSEQGEVKVFLNENVAKINGLPWPTTKTGMPAVAASAPEGQRKATVYLPSGKHYSWSVNRLILFQDDGVVTHIDITPHRGLLSFPEALKRLESICRDLKVSDQKQVSERMMSWAKMRPEKQGVMARAILDYKAGVLFRIRPIFSQEKEPQTNPNGDPVGWILTMEIDYYYDWEDLRECAPEVWKELSKGKDSKGK